MASSSGFCRELVMPQLQLQGRSVASAQQGSGSRGQARATGAGERPCSWSSGALRSPPWASRAP